jgi:hypothetical protein
VLLIEDSYTPWLRQFAGGLSEPLLVALCLLAIDRALSDRHGHALLAGAAAALIRPEVWPFLAAYAIWACRRDPRLRTATIAGGFAVAAAWFVPDLVGSGNPFEGAERARGLEGGAPADAAEVLGRAFDLVPLALWPLAALAAAIPIGPRPLVVRVLAAGALAWIALVAVMAVAGYAGLPRFMAPAAAVVCVLAGVGAAGAWRWVAPRSPGLRVAAGAVLAIAVLASLIPRAADLEADYQEARDLGERTHDLQAAAGGAVAPTSACGPVATDDALAVSALAWTLDLALSDVRLVNGPPRDAGLAVAAADGRWAMHGLRPRGQELATAGPWTVFRPCSLGTEPGYSRVDRPISVPLPIAGVTGARR